MLAENVTVSVGDKIPASLGAVSVDPFRGRKFDPLAKFLAAHPDIRELTLSQAKEIKRLCRDLGISFTSYSRAHGMSEGYMTVMFPSLASIALPRGGRGALQLTPARVAALKARVAPKAAQKRATPVPSVPAKLETRTSAQQRGTLTVTINGEEISVKIPICGKPDVEKVTNLLTALTL
jgi:hypothetical protein